MPELLAKTRLRLSRNATSIFDPSLFLRTAPTHDVNDRDCDGDVGDGELSDSDKDFAVGTILGDQESDVYDADEHQSKRRKKAQVAKPKTTRSARSRALPRVSRISRISTTLELPVSQASTFQSQEASGSNDQSFFSLMLRAPELIITRPPRVRHASSLQTTLINDTSDSDNGPQDVGESGGESSGEESDDNASEESEDDE